MEENNTPENNNITPEQIENLIERHVEKVFKLSENLIEEKVKRLQEKQQSVAKEEDQRKGKHLSGFLEFTSYFSNQASSVNRSLALAGVAIIWIFKKPVDGQPVVHGLLNFPLWCLAISLGLDLLQYTFGAIAWNIFYERKYYLWKKQGYPPAYAKDINAPNGISLPISFLFLAKIVFMLIAYVYILRYLLDKL
jgi:hypothetical protein